MIKRMCHILRSSERGNTVVEMLMVMVLLALFGITIAALIVSGIGTYNKISNKRESMANGRIAMSFMKVRIRQNDEKGRISIEKCPVSGENALLIRYEDDAGEPRVVWVYFYDGAIYESPIKPDMVPTLEVSNRLVSIDAFSIDYKDGDRSAIIMTGRYSYNDKTEEMTSVVTLRSALAEGDT